MKKLWFYGIGFYLFSALPTTQAASLLDSRFKTNGLQEALQIIHQRGDPVAGTDARRLSVEFEAAPLNNIRSFRRVWTQADLAVAQEWLNPEGQRTRGPAPKTFDLLVFKITQGEMGSPDEKILRATVALGYDRRLNRLKRAHIQSLAVSFRRPRGDLKLLYKEFLQRAVIAVTVASKIVKK